MDKQVFNHGPDAWVYIRNNHKKKPVLIYDIDSGEKLMIAESSFEAARLMGIHQGNVTQICKKTTGYCKSHGYTVEYA